MLRERGKGGSIVTFLKSGWVDELGMLVHWLFAERITLLVVLVEENGKVQRDQDDVGCAEGIRVQAAPAHDLPYFYHMPACLEEENEEEKCVAEDECEEVLVIAVAQAVVYERTVMVKVLNALVADGTMEGSLRLDDLAVRAEVIQVQAEIQRVLHQLRVVVNRAQVTGIQAHRQDE